MSKDVNKAGAKKNSKTIVNFEKILNSSLDVICAIDENSNFKYVSSASLNIWGYEPYELEGITYMDLLYKEDSQKTKDIAEQIINGKSVTIFENRYVHKNGSIVPVIWSARWDTKDKLMYCVAKDGTEKRRLERASESASARFYELFHLAPTCIGVLKGETHIFEMGNKLYLQLIGKTDIIGKSVKEVLPEVVEQGFIEILDRVFQTGIEYSAREKLVKLDNANTGQLNDTYVDIFYQPYRTDKGEIEGVFFFTNDVTAQVIAKKKNQEKDKLFRQIVETAQEGIWIIDETNKTTFVNKKMCEILEYTEEEMMNATNISFKDIEEQQKAIAQIARRKRGINEKHDSKYITKSGKQIWTNVSTNPLFTEAGTYMGALAMITDITERKTAEETLKEKQEQLLASQRIAKIGNWQMSLTNFEDIYLNDITCSEEIYRIYELLPKDDKTSYGVFSQFIYVEDRSMVARALKKSIFDNLPQSIDFRIENMNGKKKWLHQEIKTLEDSTTGAVIKLFGTIQDITTRKEHELEILNHTNEREILITELTKSLKDLKEFSFITSHNFRSPLSNLISLLDLINIQTLTASNLEIIELFKICTNQLNQTINDLNQILTIKNKIDLDISDINIRELLDDIIKSISHDIKECKCIVTCNLNVQNILSNKNYLKSILTNLISNAIKYRSPDRPLEIDISTKSLNNREINMMVKDNGIGINLKMHREKLFGLYQRFHFSTDDSTGLGLFLVKAQVNSLGGEINVESEIDKGTAFYITFTKPKFEEMQKSIDANTFII